MKRKKMNSRSVRELLTVTLMAVFFFVLFYVNIEFQYKIFMAVLVFALIFLLGLADEALRQLEDRKF